MKEPTLTPAALTGLAYVADLARGALRGDPLEKWVQSLSDERLSEIEAALEHIDALMAWHTSNNPKRATKGPKPKDKP